MSDSLRAVTHLTRYAFQRGERGAEPSLQESYTILDRPLGILQVNVTWTEAKTKNDCILWLRQIERTF